MQYSATWKPRRAGLEADYVDYELGRRKGGAKYAKRQLRIVCLRPGSTSLGKHNTTS